MCGLNRVKQMLFPQNFNILGIVTDGGEVKQTETCLSFERERGIFLVMESTLQETFHFNI